MKKLVLLLTLTLAFVGAKADPLSLSDPVANYFMANLNLPPVQFSDKHPWPNYVLVMSKESLQQLRERYFKAGMVQLGLSSFSSSGGAPYHEDATSYGHSIGAVQIVYYLYNEPVDRTGHEVYFFGWAGRR